MPSPCDYTCEMENEKCVSCGRSLDQIARWRSMSKEQQIEAMKNL